MPRVPVQVRDATVGDAAALCRLWDDLCPPPGLDMGDPPQRAVAAALSRIQEDPANRVVVAELEDRVVAALSTTDGTVVADPFVRTVEVVGLLHARAAALAAPARPRRRRGRLAVPALRRLSP